MMSLREIPFDPATTLALHQGKDNQTPHPAKDLIVEAVEELPQRQRDVVELLMWGGMTKTDAAKTLGYSRSHIHKVWRNAKERLYDALQHID